MTATARVVQDQMIFLIKSFFFVLIGLMFPTSPRLIVLGALGAAVLLLVRIPAVKLSTMHLGFTKKQTWLTIVAYSQGLGGWRAFDLTSPIRHRGRGRIFLPECLL